MSAYHHHRRASTLMPASLKDFIMKRISLSACKFFVAALGTIIGCSGLQAAPAGAAAEAQARYRQEMAVCESGQSNQDRATCRIEARRALAAARSGALKDAPGQYQGNASQRCAALKGDDQRDCESRMRGMGSVSGSAAGGGIMRETVTTTVVPAK